MVNDFSKHNTYPEPLLCFTPNFLKQRKFDNKSWLYLFSIYTSISENNIKKNIYKCISVVNIQRHKIYSV